MLKLRRSPYEDLTIGPSPSGHQFKAVMTLAMGINAQSLLDNSAGSLRAGPIHIRSL
jgi:hypothetical protein